MRHSLAWFRRLLLVCAVSLLAYCGYVLVDAWMFQRAEQARLQQLWAKREEAVPRNRRSTADGLMGRIEIPRLGISVIVMEGTCGSILGEAAGHIIGTGLPGQPGNIGISAHRDTFFRPLRNIRQNDTITVTTPTGEYRYRVLSTQVVSPSDMGVLRSSSDQILTLVTCYPFYFIGPAPNRFIVRAVRTI